MAKKRSSTSTVIEPSRYVYQTVRADEEFALSRARQDGEQSTVLVVAPVSEYPALESLARLEHEYSLRDQLDPDWALRPLALTRREGRMMLVLDDPGGQPLDQCLGKPMELGRFLRLAVNLAAGLGKLHRQWLIHKDIKPANILVDFATHKVWFTGFGIAAQLPRERQTAEPPEVIAGTLAYMAPEQTGRMNRSIDSRSDLYSLGITFYQILTGVLPFNVSDPIEWVHCHIARQPPKPSEQTERIPEPISTIVLKLLAKTAEERYQTAAGLEADLRKCLMEWESVGHIKSFPLGQQDVPDRLLIPEKLYGRDSACEILLAAFDRMVTTHKSELVLLSGYAGIGKSSVVLELHKVIVLPRGIFISGKFDQHKRDIPYATLAQAFQELARQILSKSEEEIIHWRHTILEALGPNGQLIVNLIPELELVIGKQPPVPELAPQEAQNRFEAVLRGFLGAFARKEHPLVLFLDDLQWLDPATLRLLEQLVTDPNGQHLLLIGAYRANELTSLHPLMLTLHAIRKTEAIVREIELEPLSLADVNQLLSDALRCGAARAGPLAKLVHQKTEGNPFFTIQFLTTLVEEHLLEFEAREAAWRWDLDRIRAKGFTDNVVDLMITKLRRLPALTQEALKQLSCLGNSVKISTLLAVHGGSEEEIHSKFWEAVRAGLVLRLASSYTFVHDRVQEAAYALVPEEARAEVHLRIGRVLLASMTAAPLAEHLFEVANQLNRGAARLVERDEKTQVAAIDLRAGRKAKASAAFASACVYLAAGMALLDDRDWSSQYELMFRLRLERAECEFLTGNFETAEQLIGELLQRGASKVDQAAAYHLKVLLHTVKSENAQAVTIALTCLRLFGIDIPAQPTWEQVQAEYQTVWQILDGRPIESLTDLPIMTDPELQAAMQLLSILTPPAYFTNLHLFSLLVCRMVNLSMRHGTSGASAHAYGILGHILGPVFHRYSEGYRFAKLACDLVEKYGFIAYQAKVYHAMGLAAQWTQPITTAIDFNRATIRTAIETGDLTFACYSMCQSVHGLLLRNDPLDAVWRESEKSLDFVRKAGFRDMADAIVSHQRFIATMQGRTATFSTFGDAQFDEAAFEAQLTGDRIPTMVCLYWIVKLKTRFLSGDYAEALAAADKAKALLWASAVWIQLLDYFYYTTLTMAALYEKASADEQTGFRKLLIAHREQLREWAENYPPTFGDKHALVSAELARIQGRDLDAMRLYEEAIRAARENGFVQNEGVANELAAQFYLKRGIEKVAHSYLHDARYCYLRWGALGKVQQLDERYPAMEKQASLRSTTTIGTSVEHLDLGTVMKASQAIAGEIMLEKLIETLLVIAVEHAGAERGLLILPRGEEHRIEAEARTGRDKVEVQLGPRLVTPTQLPESLLRYVIRTQESVILDDASIQNRFSEDDYLRQKRSRSVLCLPLVKQAKLMGVLYLENNLASRVFTSSRFALLELLASQAAISLDNATLYAELAKLNANLAELNADLTQENSDRRRAEEALRASEERWRKLFENSSAGIALVTPEGRYIAANLALQKMLGYTEEELRGLTSLEVSHEEDRAATKAVLAESLNGQRRNYRIEKRYRRKDDKVIWADVSSTLVPMTGSTPAFFATVIVDITERKRAEEELRESEQRLQDIVDNTTAVVFVKDLELRYLLVNREFERRHGVRRDQVGGKTDFDIHPPEVAEAVRHNDRQVIEAGLPIQFEETLPSDGGEQVYVSAKFLLRDRTGKPYAVCGIATDITDSKRAEEMQAAIVREREMFAQQREIQLGRANEALRGCLDALASVRELDDFLGQVMATMTRQFGAVSSTLRVRNFERNTLPLELVFQDGRVMSPDEAKYPEKWRNVSLVEQSFKLFLNEPSAITRTLDPHSPIPDDHRSYLLGLGVKTILVISLLSRGQVNGRLTFRFTEERDFHPEELEIARALATQASLAIQLTQLAKTARQSAVLEERNRLAGEIHDSLAQNFAGISMQLAVATEEMQIKSEDALSHVERATDLARFGLSEARRSALSLRSDIIEESGLIEALRRLVERTNIPGLLRCSFRSSKVREESLAPSVQQDLLRIAQEAISNAIRHARPTVISVSLRRNPPNLVLKIRDNGSGIAGGRSSGEGFGFGNMRARAKNIGAELDIRSRAGSGTSVIVRLPIIS
jgi:PAS domain S-box-containing protein